MKYLSFIRIRMKIEDQIGEQSNVWSLVIEMFMCTEFIKVSFVEIKLTNVGF